MKTFFFSYQKGWSVLTNFMSAWHKPEPFLKARISIDQMRSPDWPVVRFFIDGLYGKGPAYCGQRHFWTSGPEWSKKLGWTSREEQANKQYSSLASASVAASRFLPWFYFRMGSKLWAEIHFSPPRCFFVMVFIRAIETQLRQVVFYPVIVYFKIIFFFSSPILNLKLDHYPFHKV